MYKILLCFVSMCSYHKILMNSCHTSIHILQGCFTGIGAVIWLPQWQWSNPEEYGKYPQILPNHNTTKCEPCVYFMGYTVLALCWKVVKQVLTISRNMNLFTYRLIYCMVQVRVIDMTLRSPMTSRTQDIRWPACIRYPWCIYMLLNVSHDCLYATKFREVEVSAQCEW